LQEEQFCHLSAVSSNLCNNLIINYINSISLVFSGNKFRILVG